MGSLAQAGFTSIHVFGDSLSATAGTPAPAQYFYGKRYTNGRVWVEVLAQMQGLPFDPLKNTHAYFGNTSGNLYAETVAYTPPTDASNALVVIWVNNADLYYPAEDASPTLAKFNNAINLAMANHFKAVTNLYAKGIRTLVMPDVVDISTIPEFNAYALYTGQLFPSAMRELQHRILCHAQPSSGRLSQPQNLSPRIFIRYCPTCLSTRPVMGSRTPAIKGDVLMQLTCKTFSRLSLHPILTATAPIISSGMIPIRLPRCITSWPASRNS